MTKPEDKLDEDFAHLSQRATPSLFTEFIEFILHSKKWWLIPILIVFALLGGLILLSSTGAAPFIYTLF